MKIEHHLHKIERIEKTMKKLDCNEDSETLIEDCMLSAAHVINAALHKNGYVPVDKDIKHNQLSSFLIKDNPFSHKTQEIAAAIQI